METTTQQRVSRREFISRVAERSQTSQRVVSEVYDAVLCELMLAAATDESVVLTGFGKFYRQFHKGHKVRFGKQEVGGYSVLKFSAARTANRRLDALIGTEPELRNAAADPEGDAEESEGAQVHHLDEAGSSRTGRRPTAAVSA